MRYDLFGQVLGYFQLNTGVTTPMSTSSEGPSKRSALVKK